MAAVEGDEYDNVWVDLRYVEADQYLAWVRCGALGTGPGSSAVTLGPASAMRDLLVRWREYEEELVEGKAYTRYPSFEDFQLNFGINLGTAMFGQEAVELLGRAWHRSAGARGVRLVLVVHDRDLSGLPWEMLRVDLGTGESFPVALSLQQQGSIVRHHAPVHERDQAHSGAVGRRPRVVYASALTVTAPNLPRLNPRERISVESKLHAGVDVPHATVRDPVSAEELRALLSRPCDLFVFSGHGSSPSAGEAGIYVAADPQSTQGVLLSAADLGAWLVQAGVRTAVFAACDTASAQSSVSLAESVVELGVPTVIAMQAALSDDHAPKFTATIVEKLLAGTIVDLAVRDARVELQALGYLAQFGVPVIVGSPGVRLVSPPDRPSPTPIKGPAHLKEARLHTGRAPGYGIVALRGDLSDATPYLLLLPGPDLRIRLLVGPATEGSYVDSFPSLPDGVWPDIERRVLDLIEQAGLGSLRLMVDDVEGAASPPDGSILLAYRDALSQAFPGVFDAVAGPEWLGPAVADVPLHDPPNVIDVRNGEPLAWPVAPFGMVGVELTPARRDAVAASSWRSFASAALDGPDSEELESFCLAAATGRMEDLLRLMGHTSAALARRQPHAADRLAIAGNGVICRTTRRNGAVVAICTPESADAVAQQLRPLGSVRKITPWAPAPGP